MKDLPTIRGMLANDVRAAYPGDPAAKSYDEIISSYPGHFAITIYRIAHQLWEQTTADDVDFSGTGSAAVRSFPAPGSPSDVGIHDSLKTKGKTVPPCIGLPLLYRRADCSSPDSSPLRKDYRQVVIEYPRGSGCKTRTVLGPAPKIIKRTRGQNASGSFGS
ncbi:MAG: hypothetical protein AAGU11_13440 [Syntrophobacteraceae bacterium]